MTTITITKPELVRVAALFQAPESDSRYYLRGVHYERAPQGGVLIVSTDGTRLSVGYDPEGSIEGDDATVALPKPFLAKLKPDSGTLIITSDHAKLTGDKPALSESTWIDPPFPDWRRVVPENFGDTCAGAFNASYLAAYTQVGKFIGKHILNVRIVGADALSPHLVRIAGIDSWFGILMPVRREKATIPNWFRVKA